MIRKILSITLILSSLNAVGAELLIPNGYSLVYNTTDLSIPKEELFSIALDTAKGNALRYIGAEQDPRQFVQVSNWKTTVEYYLEPYSARAFTTAAFLKKEDLSQDWFVTTIGRGSTDVPYVIDEKSEQRALEHARSQAKFYCDSTLEPELLSVGYNSHGFIPWSEAEARFKCVH